MCIVGLILKKMNKITVTQLFTLGWNVEEHGFGSFVWVWDQTESTFWGYPTFNEDFNFCHL